MTTRHNLQARRDGILLETLPMTFQDAIDMTRRLGVRYLWIDALCIIQEDEEDWLKEAPQMATIYENAYLTLAATASTDSHGGLYRILPPETYERAFAYGGDGFGEATTICVRKALPHFDHSLFPETSMWMKKELPLLERAWAYQERVLSSRLLHFCNSELSFECNEGADCQCEDPGRGPPWKAHLRRMLQEKNWRGPTALGWARFVQDYTGLKMTYHKDRLPALSSIARKIAQLSPQDCYLAGMWKSTLLGSLTWSILLGEAQRYRPSHPRAPSWSWASAFGSIVWQDAAVEGNESTRENNPGHRDQVLATLVRVECNYVNGGPFGCVDSGVLTLSGKVTPGLLTWSTTRYMRYQELAWRIAAFDGLPHHERLSELMFRADYLFNHDLPGGLNVFCLWLYQTDTFWEGLALRQLDREFERIGVFVIRLKDGYNPWDYVEIIEMIVDIV
ncbi:hypothetical protein TgHK011_005772 [Trichoderma gracile]|nr:hypothetical protein TgHK011_005772 [Trichoderma gracile]